MRLCLGARDEVEVPPLRAQGLESGLPHDGAQQLSVLQFLSGHESAFRHVGFCVDMGPPPQVVDMRAHG